CGTGIGMAISANKFPGIRAAVCHDIFSTERSVLSNNCSVMCMGERVIGKELAIKMVEKWISLEFVDGSSTPKVNAIKEIERETMVEPDKIAHTKKKIG
uniref:RpiB/LacA/LacB family sugar-phosphate isomerase n=1 Tax=Eisenbergiella tayi TaxID=1432052 RepID=UPI003FEF52B5